MRQRQRQLETCKIWREAAITATASSSRESEVEELDHQTTRQVAATSTNKGKAKISLAGDARGQAPVSTRSSSQAVVVRHQAVVVGKL